MKLKALLDAEFTRFQKYLLSGAFGALLLGGGAAIALAAPAKTFSSNETLTAADLNTNFKAWTTVSLPWRHPEPPCSLATRLPSQ